MEKIQYNKNNSSGYNKYESAQTNSSKLKLMNSAMNEMLKNNN